MAGQKTKTSIEEVKPGQDRIAQIKDEISNNKPSMESKVEVYETWNNIFET